MNKLFFMIIKKKSDVKGEVKDRELTKDTLLTIQKIFVIN